MMNSPEKLLRGMLLLMALSIFFLAAACGHAQTHSEHEEHDETAVHAHDHSAESGEDFQLQLNDGEKWQADQATNTAFIRMQAVMSDYGQWMTDTTSISTFNQAGQRLQAELNTLFKTCSMKGPAHDELHVLLEQLIPKVKTLQGQETEAAHDAFVEAQMLVDSYYLYFE